MFRRNLTLIDTYSRKQAIEDGALIDITEFAKEKGFTCNVCVTISVMATIANIPEKFNYQDVKGRLWDILSVLCYKARVSKSTVIQFKLHMPHEITVINHDKPDSKMIAEEINIVSILGPGDDGEMVLTIMLPGED